MKKREIKNLFDILVIIMFLYVQQFQMSYGATVGIKNNLTIALPWVFINILIVALPFMMCLLITRKIKWALLGNIILMTVLSVINYHVLLFHGSPFLAGDIFSITTALDVASEYTMVFDSIVIRLFVICGVELIGYFLFIYFSENKKDAGEQQIKRSVTAILTIINFVLIIVLFFSPLAIFKKNLVSWSWAPAMNEYGYNVCFCNSIYAVTHLYSEPDNYDADLIKCSNSQDIRQSDVQEMLDIILILNESLADLDVYVDVEESREIFAKINTVEDIISGYTVSSLIGGGTNNSEYELLTSNSMQMLNISAPFTALNMENSTSIVSYLKKFNYTTVGMHCGNAANYNRNRAYEAMGFDVIRLGREDFNYCNKNGNRPWLDVDNYKDMLSIYEECDENPRFMYLLTYQNHGGYEQNDLKDDTIVVKGNYGDKTDDINEYLTSVDQSIDAFLELVDYFKENERKVIIMMLGDHAPAFVSELTSDKGLTNIQQEIAKRTVPYYIWTNTNIESETFPVYASMVDLVPLMIKSIGMPLTGYYQEIINLNKMVPIRTSTGHYMDKNNQSGEIKPGSEYYDLIQNYYYLEYNNLKCSEEYNSAWFELNIE